jgi:hypothetical protein
LPHSYRQVKAFALIFLKNNYFAWLLAAKEKASGKVLLTDYDMTMSETSGAIETLAKNWLEGAMIDILIDENATSKNLDYVVWEPRDDAGAEVKLRYDNAVTDYELLNSSLCSKVSASKEYKSLCDCVKELRTTTNSSERKAKRQKMMKNLKCYTGMAEKDEKLFSGWSKRTFPVLLNLKQLIHKEKGSYKQFGKAYRKIYEVQRSRLVDEMQRTASTPGILSDEQHQRLCAADDDEDSSIMSNESNDGLESNDSNVGLDESTGCVVVEL